MVKETSLELAQRLRDAGGASWVLANEAADVLVAQAEELQRKTEALEWYADRRNYLPPAPDGLHSYDALVATDAYDSAGPGARARAALAGERVPEEPPDPEDTRRALLPGGYTAERVPEEPTP